MHIDGTEDGEIHCLKEGGVAADARKTIERDTAALATATDLFASSTRILAAATNRERLLFLSAHPKVRLLLESGD